MEQIQQGILIKVPELTFGFWIIKVAATTLGETGGDAVSMSMNFGYLLGTVIFAFLFLIIVTVQIKSNGFTHFFTGQPLLPQPR